MARKLVSLAQYEKQAAEQGGARKMYNNSGWSVGNNAGNAASVRKTYSGSSGGSSSYSAPAVQAAPAPSGPSYADAYADALASIMALCLSTPHTGCIIAGNTVFVFCNAFASAHHIRAASAKLRREMDTAL